MGGDENLKPEDSPFIPTSGIQTNGNIPKRTDMWDEEIPHFVRDDNLGFYGLKKEEGAFRTGVDGNKKHFYETPLLPSFQ